MKSVIIFDLDGTLIDTQRGIVEVFTGVLKSMGIVIDNTLDIKATIGMPLEQAFSNLLGVEINDELVNYSIEQYQILFKETILPRAQELVFPGVVAGLAQLKTQGCTLAVATSKIYRSAEALLKAAGIRGYFSLVVGADQVTERKPHPEMGLLVMKKLGALAENTIMVGDTTHDLLMANGAGMRSIAVTYGVHDVEKLKSAEPTWMVNTFYEVINLVQAEH